MSEKTPFEMITAFWLCARSGGHDFTQGDVCPRCKAHKGDANLLDVIRHARAKKDNPYAQ